jgi:hypothetical protein
VDRPLQVRGHSFDDFGAEARALGRVSSRPADAIVLDDQYRMIGAVARASFTWMSRRLPLEYAYL